MEVLEPPAAPEPVPEPPPAPPPPPPAAPSRARAPRRDPPPPARRERQRSEPAPRTPAAPAPPATPASGAADRGHSWLRMRPPAEAPLAQAGPAGPPRDALGLPSNPLPDVIHHPLGKQVQGNQRTGSGLGVRTGADGAIRFDDPGVVRDVKPDLLAGQLGISGRFDINDVTERLAGNDPYSYEKRKIAEATFEDRLLLAGEARHRARQDGLYHLKERLERLLRVPGLTGAARREMLFDMWDECLDDLADGEPNLGAGARATIVAFARRAFPPGSAEAYTREELAALNRRRSSRNPFDPYGPSSSSGSGSGAP
jgi:hypothetical protein